MSTLILFLVVTMLRSSSVALQHSRDCKSYSLLCVIDTNSAFIQSVIHSFQNLTSMVTDCLLGYGMYKGGSDLWNDVLAKRGKQM